MSGYTRGEVTGTVLVEDGQFGKILKVSEVGKQYAKTIYVGDRYEGDLPESGAKARVVFSTAPPKPGRKYGSSYLDGWEPSNGQAAPAAANGQAHESNDDKQDRISHQWALNWAVAVHNAGIVKAASLDELFSLAAQGFFYVQEVLKPSPDQPIVEGSAW